MSSIINNINIFLHQGYGILLLNAFLALFILSFSRLVLTCLYHKKVPKKKYLYIFLQGIRIDIATTSALIGPGFIILSIVNIFNLNFYPILVINNIYLTISVLLLILNEVNTKPFIDEYGVRPNHIYVEYLIYPKEIVNMMLSGHKLLISLVFCILIASFYGLFSMNQYFVENYQTISPILSGVIFVLGLVVLPLCVRSTLGHRPMNPTMISFCQNPLINTLPLNSTYSAMYALTHLNQNKLTLENIHSFADEKDIIKYGKELAINHSYKFPDELIAKNPFLQHITPQSKTPKNLVIILMESLGAEFIESLGGKPLTPNIENLKHHGWFFENMYAAGHRSIRGIEAVVCGFPPSPINSTVKLPKPSAEYANLPALLKEKGYSTSFIYGGESHFDNMRGYFLENGVDEIIDEKDYKNPSFVGSWGVCDEDLFDRANERFEQYNKEGKKFCSVVFTSSFHDPFDIPAGKVSLDNYQSNDPARHLGVKYADYAIGQFFKKAMNSSYYKDTIFLLIADHEHRVKSSDDFPISQFRIPALIMGSDNNYIDKRIVSQIDMLPTLLSLCGYEGDVPCIGNNLTINNDNKKEGRAIMQYHNIFGFLENNKLTTLAPNANEGYYEVDNNKIKTLNKDEQFEKYKQKAIALVNLGPYLYKNELLTLKYKK